MPFSPFSAQEPGSSVLTLFYAASLHYTQWRHRQPHVRTLHSSRQPSAIQQHLNLQAQPYCQPDVNAGQQEDALHLLANNNQSQAETEQGAASPQQYVQALGQEKFMALIHRIVKAHQQVSMACWHTSRLLFINDVFDKCWQTCCVMCYTPYTGMLRAGETAALDTLRV